MAVNIYTMGETAHGKTTLTAAIAYCLGTAYANLQDGAEPSAADGRGVSHLTYATPANTFAHSDCAAAVTDTMLAVSTKMDVGILLVSASDGPMPGTRDALASARKHGVSNIVVFLNKTDLVDDEALLELIEMEIRELLSSQKYPGDDVPVIAGSALGALSSAGTQDDPKAKTIFALMDAVDKTYAHPL